MMLQVLLASAGFPRNTAVFLDIETSHAIERQHI